MLTFHHTCIGSSHLASGKPCQDASFAGTIGDLHLAIVSDGHGGAIHSRSDVGAQLAIYAVQGVIEEHPLSDWENPDKRQELFQEIVERWIVLTIDHYYDNLTEQEIAQLPLFPDVEQSIRNITVLYGCTLMAACVHPNGWFAFQIGDGKCVTINQIQTCPDSSEDNSTFNIQKMATEPIPADDRCFLNMTTSLCDPNAATEFRFCGGNTDTTPVAIFLGSDGIDNSWGTEQALHNFYIEVLKHCTSAEDVTRDLAEALPQLSQAGSQDDMSVATIVNKDLLAKNIAIF
jgi:serine/threonine protein phosphatase PrpC